MRETTPAVFVIARPTLDWTAIHEYLTTVGGTSWVARAQQIEGPPSEGLIEFAGRICYRSWEAGLNPNVRNIRTDRARYFDNILASGHGSILEHATFSFVFQSVSRVFTHELVRHRAGVAISQESLRFVRLTDIGLRIPDDLADLRSNIVTIVEALEDFQVQAADRYGLDNEQVPFHVKKEITSALRRLAPLGLSTDVLWTANLRTLRHVIAMRTAVGAEEEMRLVFGKIAALMKRECPLLFADFSEDGEGQWVPKYFKV
jgi:thymidylate synthase (FAD)